MSTRSEPQSHTRADASATSTTAAAPDLGLTMTRVLRNPLSALRASMETLVSEFRADDPRSLKLSGALDQVLSMSHDVEALLQLAAPRPLAPLNCSVDEILESALRRQRFEHRARVRIARPTSPEPLCVDGPLLADCLARLLEHALSSHDGEVLLSTRRQSEAVCFGIVALESAPQDDAHGGRPLPLQRSAALELGLAVARRDAARMNATFESSRTERGLICLSVTVPERRREADPSQG